MDASHGTRAFNSLVQICRPDGSVAGTGYVVSATSVLTCAHVALEALGLHTDADKGDLPEDALIDVKRLFVDGRKSSPRSTGIGKLFGRQADMHTDIAVLTLKVGAFDIDEYPIAEHIDLVDIEKARLSAYGFPPDATNMIDPMAPAYYCGVELMPNGWFHALSEAAHGQEIRPGFSGAPVFDRATQCVVGMICEADAERRTANIIPTALLREVVSLSLAQRISTASREAGRESQRLEISDPGWRRIVDAAAPGLYSFIRRMRSVSDPPERSRLTNFLRENKAELKQDLVLHSYLPPPSRELASDMQGMLPRAKHQFFTPVQQLLKEISEASSGGDAASAQISALSRRTRVVRDLGSRLLKSTDPLIVLGEPGSGKSMTLKQVAIVLAEINAKRVFPTLCVYIPVGRWQPVTSPSVADVEHLVALYAGGSLAPLLKPLAEQQRLVVIFDGLDEMSRVRYVAHTEALSKYAEKYRGQVKTLFSCRIADFTPVFKHHRLILLPFQHRHVRAYLERQFGKSPMTVSGSIYTVAQVARRLEEPEIPIDPHNPFSLWLICLYLREEMTWPTTRADLLRYYVDYQYDRKHKEARDAGSSLPSKVDMLRSWGALAWRISYRNTGTDIGLYEIREMFGMQADEIIAAGRSCDILQRSTEHDLPLVRFAHHRLQEYFTALNIVENNVSVDWRELLDVPRWQEVLVYVSQMPNSEAPLETLGEMLDDVFDSQMNVSTDIVERVLLEAIAAERVELGARVLRNLPVSQARDDFSSRLVRAAYRLSVKGNPVSQVKMLGVARDVAAPELDAVVNAALKSDIAWVRGQAHVVAATRKGATGGSTLLEEIAQSFSAATVLTLLRQFYLIGKRSRDRRVTLLAAVSALAFIVQALVTASLAPLTAVLLAARIPAVAEMANGWLGGVVLSCSVVALAGSLVFAPRFHWAITQSAGFGSLGVVLLAGFLWELAPGISLGLAALLLLFGGYCALLLLAVTTLLIWIAAIVVWAAILIVPAVVLRIMTGSAGAVPRLYSVGAREAGFSEYFDEWAELTLPRLGMFGAILLALLGPFVFGALPDWGITAFLVSHQFFHFSGVSVGLSALLNLLPVASLAIFILAGVAALRARSVDPINTFSPISFSLLAFTAVAYALSVGIPLAFGWISSSFPSTSGSWALQIIAVALVGVIVIAAAAALMFLARRLWNRVSSYFVRFNETKWTPESFHNRLKEISAVEQAALLRWVSAEKLGVDANALHEFLISIEASVKADPARGEYFARRAEMLAVLRQERIG